MHKPLPDTIVQGIAEQGPIDVLLVEDSPSDSDLAKRALGKSESPINFTIIHNGLQAIEYLIAKSGNGNLSPSMLPKVILLDLKMSFMNGMEVLRILKSDDRTKLIPIVIFTSSREPSDIQHCYEHGANGYVVKPLEYDQYNRCILDTCRYWLTVNCPPC